ncbi:hypothetical protein Fuma_04456 [Fuerstiella marisgermanici]|uniref:Uncharacterized protein n=1 Tax=Fuerstiella marisgermanici TaxID=1891926 RepID=A0A1P8WL96_9PLAN|nr:hypothetical protein Fuma_04456 [Fuerstiella marisgermanici]
MGSAIAKSPMRLAASPQRPAGATPAFQLTNRDSPATPTARRCVPASGEEAGDWLAAVDDFHGAAEGAEVFVVGFHVE